MNKPLFYKTVNNIINSRKWNKKIDVLVSLKGGVHLIIDVSELHEQFEVNDGIMTVAKRVAVGNSEFEKSCDVTFEISDVTCIMLPSVSTKTR